MLYVLIALPLAFAARDGGKGGSADYKRSNRKNSNPAATISCVLETDKSGAYRPECQGETIKCKQGEDCLIQCLGQSDRCAGDDKRDCKPCYGTTFVGADGYDMTFTCEGDSACQDVTIQCPDHGECNIRLSGGNGDAQYGMKGANIIGAADKGAMTVENNQVRSGFEGATITCPTDAKCTIMAGEAYKQGYFPGELIEETSNIDAYKNADIDGSKSSGLYVVTEGADRPFQNANLFCPPRERGRGPACEIQLKGGQAMMASMHVHVEDSVADVSVNCQYADDLVAECYGDESSSPYDDDPNDVISYKLPYMPTLECGHRGGMMGNFDADCVMILDTGYGGDVFTCKNFEDEAVCDAPEHAGGFCGLADDSEYEQRGEDERAGSKCDRYSDQESCYQDYDCVWQAYDGDDADSDSDADSAISEMMAAAKVTISDAFEGNASSTLYLALSLVLFGSSAGVYYAWSNKKLAAETHLAFDDDGVTYA